MIELTYDSTLTRLRGQCVNLLSGKYIKTGGIHPRTLKAMNGGCFGCHLVKPPNHFPDKLSCYICPLAHVAERLGHSCIAGEAAIGYNGHPNPQFIFDTINVIDDKLEENQQ